MRQTLSISLVILLLAFYSKAQDKQSTNPAGAAAVTVPKDVLALNGLTFADQGRLCARSSARKAHAVSKLLCTVRQERAKRSFLAANWIVRAMLVIVSKENSMDCPLSLPMEARSYR